MEHQHVSVIDDLNNAAWSDSHGAAHEPRRDRNTMKQEEDAYLAKQDCSSPSVELSVGWQQGTGFCNFSREYGHKLPLEYLNTMVLEMTHR